MREAPFEVDLAFTAPLNAASLAVLQAGGAERAARCLYYAAVQLAVRMKLSAGSIFIAASVAESVEYVRGIELRAFLQATVPEGRPCAVRGLPPDPFSRLAICGGLARRLDALSMGCETGRLCAPPSCREATAKQDAALRNHTSVCQNFGQR